VKEKLAATMNGVRDGDAAAGAPAPGGLAPLPAVLTPSSKDKDVEQLQAEKAEARRSGPHGPVIMCCALLTPPRRTSSLRGHGAPHPR